MGQANLRYDQSVGDLDGLPTSLSIFADRTRMRGQMHDAAEAAGFRVAEAVGLDTLLDGDARPLGDVVLVDCPQISGARLAALARIDQRVAHAGSQLLVSTSLAAIDDVFGCLDQSDPQLLVDASHAELVIALGRARLLGPSRRVREMSDGDRTTLLRLTQEVGRIAERIEYLCEPTPTAGGEMPVPLDPGGETTTAELPDAPKIRRIIRQRQLRARFFDAALFADPAWDILLDLAAARAEGQRVSVSSLCIAAGVPPTTALRWIGQLTEVGLLQRQSDQADRRRAFVSLTDRAEDGLTRYFDAIGPLPVLVL